MALLDAVVHPSQPQGHLGYGHRDYCSYGAPFFWSDATGHGDNHVPYAGDWDPFLLASLVHNAEESGKVVGSSKASPEREVALSSAIEPPSSPVMTTTAKRKRRRANKVVKNEEEMESQRMTHIAVERNRRRQMNEYLAVLRSLMPPSYGQRVYVRLICFIIKYYTTTLSLFFPLIVGLLYIYIYIYDAFLLHARVVTLIYISLDLRCI